MKYLIIAGERSGDMHAARVAGELQKTDLRAELVGIGGDYMAAAGVTIFKHYQAFSFMGIMEVLFNLLKVKRTIGELKKIIKRENPDVAIFVDFPGINMQLVTYAHKIGIKTCYYIAPKTWAWKEYRVRRIKKVVQKMFVILPFERDYFRSKGYEVEYVGNPLLDEIKSHRFSDLKMDTSLRNIAVLPGSRKQEIRLSAAGINELAAANSAYEFHIAKVDNVDDSLYASYKELRNITFHVGKTYELLKTCNAAIVTSGTATLEAALLNCPQVVVYRANALSVSIAKLLVKIKWFSLVNLIGQKEIVKELLQNDYTAENVMAEIEKIVNDHQYCAEMLANYQELRVRIGSESASKNVARKIVAWLDPELV